MIPQAGLVCNLHTLISSISCVSFSGIIQASGLFRIPPGGFRPNARFGSNVRIQWTTSYENIYGKG